MDVVADTQDGSALQSDDKNGAAVSVYKSRICLFGTAALMLVIWINCISGRSRYSIILGAEVTRWRRQDTARGCLTLQR